ncbi:chromosome partitioning protein ParB [Tardibacter chloracetimidivorans]|uniref:Chromosome partitioning protein ParB n=3 Tax=Alphaproteobacteria TaxID=28211 RepID=A0A1L3ZX79_9SPHN|nr:MULTISPECIES: PRTRC system ParB family protein [Sphingomonadaceae]API60199.1 chromosome partitioning protein ParB [Tardibacter chloracetimidivorans]BAV66657.1 chromosome partitioning protein ParB [Sphingobium cloacae]
MTPSHPNAATTLSLSKIMLGYNPRRYFDRKKHEDLVASFRLRGMLQPMLLRPAADVDDTYVVVAGGRRYRAALEAFGPEGEVPVVIREMTDQEALEAAIDENDNRDDASETEQADAAVRVLAACQNDRAEAARRLGWSQSKFDRRLALANLSDAVKLALDERRIKVGHAELLAAIPADKQDKALDTITASGLDVGKTRDLLMRVTQDLANACFDKTECMACPFNSGTQRALFETHVDEGHCTNPGCFQLKTEAIEKARIEAQERAAAAAQAEAADRQADGDDGEAAPDADELANTDDDGDGAASRPGVRATAVAANRSSSGAIVKPAARADGATVSVKSIAGRTADLREATWRTALARGLADNPSHAHAAILVAGLTGTLAQIKPATLTSRAGLLVSPSFPDLSFGEKIEGIRALSDAQAATALAAIAAAYARDVQSFAHVADLARAFAIDIRHGWRVDRSFLERYTKDELKFIAQECGLIAHLGEKAFAKLLASKKADLVAGMLNAVGFDWTGRLPSGMTLDGKYGPPPAPLRAEADRGVSAIAA